MVTIKLKFNPSCTFSNEGSLYYEVKYKRKKKNIQTEYCIRQHEWNKSTASLNLNVSDDSRRDYLNHIQHRVIKDMRAIGSLVAHNISSGVPFTIDTIVSQFHNRRRETFLFVFMDSIVRKLQNNGQIRTAETYRSTLNSFKRFRQNEDILIDDIDSELICDYEKYLKLRGLSLNTISFYLRKLRAIYNRAVESQIVCEKKLFKKVFTASEKTSKRAISIAHIKQIKKLKLKGTDAFARDMFLFSFYTRGMSFVDIAFLKKSNLNNGILVYRRRKTLQNIYMRWEPCMQTIVARYWEESDSPYLFPIIRDLSKNEYHQYRNKLTIINRHLKVIGDMIDLPIPLTMYVARHSWATIARNQGVPLSVISEALGHDSESTTKIYLASIGAHLVDKANKQILKLL